MILIWMEGFFEMLLLGGDDQAEKITERISFYTDMGKRKYQLKNNGYEKGISKYAIYNSNSNFLPDLR